MMFERLLKSSLLSMVFFMLKLHLSSSRSTLWFYDDLSLSSACTFIAKQAVVSISQVKQLRHVEETIYLRAGSINIINGMVTLNFSCDGPHDIPCEDFFDEGQDFWVSETGSTAGG